eukprot:GILI01027652.1.p1 GENE.GILI01027652.1~~GILI01027652.1.p1  ORF type:complete len:186 (+),score=13.71 GILI01027652.1:72-629(+)
MSTNVQFCQLHHPYIWGTEPQATYESEGPIILSESPHVRWCLPKLSWPDRIESWGHSGAHQIKTNVTPAVTGWIDKGGRHLAEASPPEAIRTTGSWLKRYTVDPVAPYVVSSYKSVKAVCSAITESEKDVSKSLHDNAKLVAKSHLGEVGEGAVDGASRVKWSRVFLLQPSAIEHGIRQFLPKEK